MYTVGNYKIYSELQRMCFETESTFRKEVNGIVFHTLTDAIKWSSCTNCCPTPAVYQVLSAKYKRVGDHFYLVSPAEILPFVMFK